MIDKRLTGSKLYVYMEERYPKDKGDIYKSTDSGILIAKTEEKKLPKPFELAIVKQIGIGFDKDGNEISKLYKEGDLIRIFPRRGADFDLGEEKGWITMIDASDIISIV